MAKHKSSTAVVFKVALSGRKNVWRRIAVRGDQTLDDLHEAIFDAFDRDDEHLYSFYFSPPGTKSRRNIQRNSIEYTHPEAIEEGFYSRAEVHDAATAPVGALALQPKQTIYYLFDFGDEWWHEITVEQIDVPVEAGDYPRLLESKGKSPPQYPDLDEEDEEDD
jgi:hypothetical protein